MLLIEFSLAVMQGKNLFRIESNVFDSNFRNLFFILYIVFYIARYQFQQNTNYVLNSGFQQLICVFVNLLETQLKKIVGISSNLIF